MGGIAVIFSCPICGLGQKSVRVRERWENEDVKTWLDDVVMETVSLHHSIWSPMCFGLNIDLVIPASTKLGVGHKT